MATKTKTPEAPKKRFSRKVTVRDAGLTPEVLEKVVEKYGNRETPILKAYGTAESMEVKTGDLGPYTVFHGSFQGESTVDGSKIRGKQLILPEIPSMFLEGELQSAQADNPKASLQFGLMVTVKATNTKNKNIAKYQFAVQPLIESGTPDALDQMGSMIEEHAGSTKLLELE